MFAHRFELFLCITNNLSSFICFQTVYMYSICPKSRVFTNDPGDRRSIPGRVIPKTQKMVLDAALLITHHYKVRIIKGKMEQSWEWSTALPYISVLKLLKREHFGHSRLRSPTLCVCVCVCVCALFASEYFVGNFIFE